MLQYSPERTDYTLTHEEKVLLILSIINLILLHHYNKL